MFISESLTHYLPVLKFNFPSSSEVNSTECIIQKNLHKAENQLNVLHSELMTDSGTTQCSKENEDEGCSRCNGGELFPPEADLRVMHKAGQNNYIIKHASYVILP